MAKEAAVVSGWYSDFCVTCILPVSLSLTHAETAACDSLLLGSTGEGPRSRAMGEVLGLICIILWEDSPSNFLIADKYPKMISLIFLPETEYCLQAFLANLVFLQIVIMACMEFEMGKVSNIAEIALL